MSGKAAFQPAEQSRLRALRARRRAQGSGSLGGTPHGGGHGQAFLQDRLKRICLGMGRVVVSQTCLDFPLPPGAGPSERIGAS